MNSGFIDRIVESWNGLGRSLVFFMVFMLVFPVDGIKAQSSEDADSIRSLRAESNRAIAEHDVDGIISFLDNEYVIAISTGAIEHSREEQVESWAQHFARYPDVVYVRTPSEITISETYPHAMEIGTWVGSRTTEDGKQDKGGQYSAGWRKVDGVWKIHSEIFIAIYCHGVDC